MPRTAPFLCGALAAVLAILVIGCSGDAAPDRPSAGAAATPAAAPPPNTDERFRTGLPDEAPNATASAAPAPNSVAGNALASIPLVVELHGAASASRQDTGLPRGAATRQAADVDRRLGRLGAALRAERGGTAARLRSALARYRAVAQRLRRSGSWPGLSRDVAATDTRWRAALRAIDRTAGTELEGMVPSLVPPDAAPDLPAPGRS